MTGAVCLADVLARVRVIEQNQAVGVRAINNTNKLLKVLIKALSR